MLVRKSLGHKQFNRGATMGVGIYPCFKPRIPGAEFACDGKILLREYDFLDDIAREKGFTPLSSFGDRRPVPEGFDGGPDELRQILGPWEEWFPVHNASQTVGGLINALSSNAVYRRESEFVDDLICELQELRRCFKIAAEHQAMFRFDVF
jgi:hypothetical protein